MTQEWLTWYGATGDETGGGGEGHNVNLKHAAYHHKEFERRSSTHTDQHSQTQQTILQ